MKFPKTVVICVVLVVSLWPCPVPALCDICEVKMYPNVRTKNCSVEIRCRNGAVIAKLNASCMSETGKLDQPNKV